MGLGEGHCDRYDSFFLPFFGSQSSEKKDPGYVLLYISYRWYSDTLEAFRAKVCSTGYFIRHERSNRTVGFDHEMIETCSCIHGDEVKETRSE